ncbi:hypothetical protein [Odoribacter sp. AF15-53]|uniref:hypothetical protein n=1 Tax=Odoribacter sp. AF15-53 TaxID=2292236 RepID=UPI0013148F42|nr:hypothetical protein [Odoribacter sp. AF15-53]
MKCLSLEKAVRSSRAKKGWMQMVPRVWLGRSMTQRLSDCVAPVSLYMEMPFRNLPLRE